MKEEKRRKGEIAIEEETIRADPFRFLFCCPSPLFVCSVLPAASAVGVPMGWVVGFALVMVRLVICWRGSQSRSSSLSSLGGSSLYLRFGVSSQGTYRSTYSSSLLLSRRARVVWANRREKTRAGSPPSLYHREGWYITTLPTYRRSPLVPRLRSVQSSAPFTRSGKRATNRAP